MLAGEIRSGFAMTEPDVASSDATNIACSIAGEGDHYVINGRKWFTTGAMRDNCEFLLVMGKTDPDNPDRHKQQSMILVPKATPGVTMMRHVHSFGYNDAPFGEAEIHFHNARVSRENILLGEGRGFEIAQGRLGPGRIHHCMRLVGCAQRALELAQQGAFVIISSRKQEGCEEVAKSIRDEDGQATAYACHIGAPEQIEALFSHIRDEYGHLDILVNNAAANPYYGPITETDPGAFTKTVDVNIRGYFFMSVNACRMMKQNGGAIVNVASVDGIRPGAKRGIYSITKGAIINMTKAFALECGPDNIRVNALLPGLTETKFAGALTGNKDVLNAWLQQMPLRRCAQPDEMAGAILFLASPASAFATGSIVPVDGGYLI